MAFLRYARANVVRPQVHTLEWDKVRVASGANRLNSSLKKKAEEILKEPFTPDRFLLTHSTIVCSVDAVSVPGVKTGSLKEGNFQINRKYPDYQVTSQTDKYINNNLDCWSRGVIKKSYKTFVGAHNFVEHVQVEELSKGRIIDAVLRDIGESIYVDILVATDKKHTELVDQIVSGKMNAMSMGCSVDFTICTKCGHVASDEAQMCNHVKYEKGNVFYDEQGNKHRIAELCGHETEGETGGVRFIEASWVAIPAFRGAVARNTLEIPQSKSASLDSHLNQIPSQWVDKTAFSFDDDDDDKKEEEKKPAKPPVSDSLLDEIEDVVKDAVITRLRKKLDQEIKNSLGQDKPNPPTASPTTTDDTIIKEASVVYMRNLSYAIKKASTRNTAVDNIRVVNDHFDVYLPSYLYKTAKQLKRANEYASVNEYLKDAENLLGFSLNDKDSLRLVKLAKLISNKAER